MPCRNKNILLVSYFGIFFGTIITYFLWRGVEGGGGPTIKSILAKCIERTWEQCFIRQQTDSVCHNNTDEDTCEQISMNIFQTPCMWHTPTLTHVYGSCGCLHIDYEQELMIFTVVGIYWHMCGTKHNIFETYLERRWGGWWAEKGQHCQILCQTNEKENIHRVKSVKGGVDRSLCTWSIFTEHKWIGFRECLIILH